ncbi:MAG: VWA domain-containing protein [Thiotrichaceae bacterium]|nr:VWA domain-containing protein [Thiotrichaceae bacterium]
MLEEIVGSVWHRFITQRADSHYPEAIVYLEDIRHIVSVFFRALGGEGGLRVENSTESKNHSRRTILERIAGVGHKVQYAWRDEEALKLPESIAIFPTQQLNKDLYLWLVALSAVELNEDNREYKNWITRNQYRTREALAIWPGLMPRYQQLVEAHLKQRYQASDLPKDEAAQEVIICNALNDPMALVDLHYAKRPPQPVPLWLHPSPEKYEFQGGTAPQDPDIEEGAQSKKDQQKQQTRKSGNREDMVEGNDGLISFRLESLWSWAEYSKVDRTSTDDDDDDAMRTAEDMDNITVAQDSETTASKIKLDLDLPSSDYDDIVLGDGIPLDEWDYKKQYLQKDHCRLQVMMSRDAEPIALPEHLQQQVKKIRRQFEVLKPQRHWESRQQDGMEIDLESYINFLADRKHHGVQSDMPIYRELRNKTRDMSCLLLADLSLSTDAHINNHSRVIDVIRDSLFLFSEALSVTGDRFALHGFSSRNRSHIRFYKIKNFDEKYDDSVRGFIQAARPGYYTRLGAAIRYASSLLEAEASSQKLLLIFTDGKPNDLDKYEGRYGIEDTRMAVLEAEKKGLRPFCITIDEEAENYLPYLFGSKSFVVIQDANELPKKLPQLYLRLTSGV